MNLSSRIIGKLVRLWRKHILRAPFLLAADRWFEDKGDETLPLDYPLSQESVVFDLGGYHGDFAAAVHQRYGCKVYIFEPVQEFYEQCTARFKGNNKVVCFNYGLSSFNGWLNIGLADNGSSFFTHHTQQALQWVQIRSVVECIKELGIDRIDLMKINIEGGEFDVVPAIIDSGDIGKVFYLQVQFHNFVDEAVKRRTAIRAQLNDTHTEMWNYEFIWESWVLKTSGC